ncbi:MAG: hypothetical protein U9P12_00535, partial [Verrucomicrobiota bacterium]|nr:hypothetical protein [Verrucomicrobiota bacterium]
AVSSTSFSNTLYSGASGSCESDIGYHSEAIAGLKSYSWIADANTCVIGVVGFAYEPPPTPQTIAVENTGSHYEGNVLASNLLSGFTVADGRYRKLVAVVNWESDATVPVTGITYGGQTLTEGVTAFPSVGRRSSIWYLDDPAVGTADLVVSFDGAGTKSVVNAMSLQNTAPGGPVVSDTATGTGEINLTTFSENTFVIGAYADNAVPLVSSNSFANTLYNGDGGSCKTDVGYQNESATGAKTYTWYASDTNSSAIAIAGFAGSSEASTVAVDFAGDYRDGNQNAIKTLVLETGDYDFDGTADDRRGYRAIGSVFLNPIIIEAGKEAGVAGKNKNLYAGYQIANLNSAVDPLESPNYKYSGSGDSAMATSAAGTTDMGMAFAPYVKKPNFLNGYNNVTNLVFEDIAGSASFSVRQFDGGQTARALVQNGSTWYVSGSEVTSTTTLSLNGYTETWYEFDPATSLFINPASLGAGVSGSTLIDIQAFGAFVQGIGFDGTGANAANLQIDAFSMFVTATNVPVVVSSVTDDFNRTDTAWSSDSSLIRSDWASSGTNVWRINGSSLEVDVPDQGGETAILYNTSKQTVSGGSSGFTLSTDMTATTNEQWCGIVFNYQNPSNYYMLRIKTGTTSYHFIPVVDGVNGADLELNADALVTWAEGTSYTFTVSSYTPYEFSFEITETGSSTVLNPVTSVSFAISHHNGGYAGFWAIDGNIVGLDTVPDIVFDNFNLTVSVPEAALTFDGWIADYSVGGQTAMTDDFDGDGMNNLTEYALGGDPSVYDAGAVLPLSVADTGNGLFVYVYDRRLDAGTRELTYRLEVDSNLLANTWTTNGVTEVGTETLDTEFEAVTNTVPLDQAEKFLRLQIEVAE